VVPAERIARSIVVVRGRKVLLDAELATLYGVRTKALVQAVKRNSGRFPADFLFGLTPDEATRLRSQSVTSKSRGGRRYLPYAFTEQGVAMLSSVLRSPRAIAANIEIMRVFVKLREVTARSWKKRSMIPCHSSGSSCSASSIERFTSAKTTVTCLRSPCSAARVVRIFSAR